MILDATRATTDDAYRADMRHRFLTDHFFAAKALGFTDFSETAHRPAVDLYFGKNPNLPIRDQHAIHKRLHLDPRHSFKTTLKRVDRIQWIAAFPEEMTILVNSATQPLAKTVCELTARHFYSSSGVPVTDFQLLFPELIVSNEPRGGTWNNPRRRMTGAGDMDATLDFTSPKSAQSGWHPLLMEPDDVEDTLNSGIGVNPEVRQHVIDVCDQNENLLRDGGYVNVCGTRYHPFDYYGKCIELARNNPGTWKILVRASINVKSGTKLVPGEFPAEDDCELQFPGFANLSYRELKYKFEQNYESFMCYRAGCKVLMADWTERPIEDLKPGDEIVGFEKQGQWNTRFVKTRVVRTFQRRAECAEVITDDGRKTYPTFDHRFLRPPNGGEHRYLPLKVGSKLVSAYIPWKPPSAPLQRSLDWLGGIIDGEGSFPGGSLRIYQSKKLNPEVYARIAEVLRSLELSWEDGKTHQVEHFSVHGGRSLLIWLLQNAPLAKRNNIEERLWGSKQLAQTFGRRGGTKTPTVVSMESLGVETVYDIETETHNFICDGFCTHNCQQQNDPQGGHIPTFDEKLYQSCIIEQGRIPVYHGDTLICWRPPYLAKNNMKLAEGACAKVVDGKVYILDAWQGNYTPSGLAEKIVASQKNHQADAVMLVYTPGAEYLWQQVRNEAARRNVSMRLQWIDWQEDDTLRDGQIKQLEPLMKVGRLLFSTAMGRQMECHKQFVHYGLVPENGIIECIAKFADRVPFSLMRANMDDEELEWQRRQREDGLVNAFLRQQGMPQVDEQAKQRAAAHAKAMSRAVTFGVPPLPGGLDG